MESFVDYNGDLLSVTHGLPGISPEDEGPMGKFGACKAGFLPQMLCKACTVAAL